MAEPLTPAELAKLHVLARPGAPRWATDVEVGRLLDEVERLRARVAELEAAWPAYACTGCASRKPRCDEDGLCVSCGATVELVEVTQARADEREACAVLCDGVADQLWASRQETGAMALEDLAKALRARGAKP